MLVEYFGSQMCPFKLILPLLYEGHDSTEIIVRPCVTVWVQKLAKIGTGTLLFWLWKSDIYFFTDLDSWLDCLWSNSVAK